MPVNRIKLSREELNKVITALAFSGSLSLYAFYLAYDSKKPFTFASLEKAVSFLPANYSLAFLVFAQASDLIQITSNSIVPDPPYTAIGMDPDLAQLIKGVVYDKADKNDKSISTGTQKKYFLA